MRLKMKKNERNKYLSQEAMENRKKTINQMIDDSINEIDNEIQKIKNGDISFTTSDDLIKIKNELYIMKQKMSPKQYIPVYPHKLIDSVDFWKNIKLVDKLLKTARYYSERLI